MNNRGKEAENQALKWLLSKKLTLVVANYSCRQGEIDLIMLDSDVLVFIEVRLRSSQYFGGAANSVDYKKQQKIAIAAQHFLMCHTKYSQYSCRFDVIAFKVYRQIFNQYGIKTPSDFRNRSMELEDRIINQFHNAMDVNAHTIEQFTPLIAHASEILLHCLASENKILCVGNGGSAALTQHFSALLLSKFRTERPGLPAMCLSNDTCTLTAIIEDISFSDVYAKQIRAFGQPGDVLLLATTHGKASSLVQAIQAAHDREMVVIVLNGGDGGDVTALLRPDEVEVSVPSNDNILIHNTHLLVLHCLCDLIDYQLFGAQ